MNHPIGCGDIRFHHSGLVHLHTPIGRADLNGLARKCRKLPDAGDFFRAQGSWHHMVEQNGFEHFLVFGLKQGSKQGFGQLLKRIVSRGKHRVGGILSQGIDKFTGFQRFDQ